MRQPHPIRVRIIRGTPFWVYVFVLLMLLGLLATAMGWYE